MLLTLKSRPTHDFAPIAFDSAPSGEFWTEFTSEKWSLLLPAYFMAVYTVRVVVSVTRSRRYAGNHHGRFCSAQPRENTRRLYLNV